MESQNSIAIIWITLVIFAISQVKSGTAMIKVEDNSINWHKLTNRLGNMMLNSVVAQHQKPINVLIFSMVDQTSLSEFNGMHQSLSKILNGKLTFNLEDLKYKTVNTASEYSILLMHSNIQNFHSVMKDNFLLIFPDLLTKFIVIMIGSLDIRMVYYVWSMLTMTGYYNVYMVQHHNSGTFNIWRTYIDEENFQMIPTNDTKYITVKEMSNDSWILDIRVVFYNSYPMSYIRNGEIIGAEGKLIQEFSKRTKIPFRIVNTNVEKFSMHEIIMDMILHGDICLYVNLNLKGDNFYNVWLNEMDGLCILTPRNIPVSSYENLALPLDAASLVISFVSTVSVIVSWKVLSIYTKNKRSLKSIIIAVIEIVFNIGASGIEHITKKEIILVYSFIFSSFILVSFYESLLLAFMLAEPSWRSAHDLTELNDSGAKFFTFYDRDAAIFGKIPYIREELIQNVVGIGQRLMNKLLVPENFDKNLVYLVSCKYADSFMKSTRNFHENRRIFDTIKITEMLQGYPVRNGFLFANEFKDLVATWTESGIYKFWQQKSLEMSLKSNKLINIIQEDYFDMVFPLILLITGCSVSLAIFLHEIFTESCKSANMNRVKVIGYNQQNQGVKRKLNMTKWMITFIYKKKSKKSEFPIQFIPVDHKKEALMSRESVTGSYFVMKRMRKIRKIRKYPEIVQVRPCNRHE